MYGCPLTAFPRDAEKHSGGKRKLLRMLTASDNKRTRLPIHGKTSKHHRALGLDRQPEISKNKYVLTSLIVYMGCILISQLLYIKLSLAERISSRFSVTECTFIVCPTILEYRVSAFCAWVALSMHLFFLHSPTLILL